METFGWVLVGALIGGIIGGFVGFGRAYERAVLELDAIRVEYEMVIRTLQERLKAYE